MIRVRELADGVTQLTMTRQVAGRGLYRVAAYLVDGVLVDTGMAHTAGEIDEALTTRQIRSIVNTHSHGDHNGGNHRLQDRRGQPVLAHALAVPVLADPERLELRAYQRFLFGRPAPSRAEATGDTVATVRGTLHVLATPGHSRDHISLLDPSRGWLFCGDAYIGGRGRVLREDYDVWGMIATYDHLSHLDLERLCTGSGAIVDRPRERLAAKVAYLEERGEEVREFHRQRLDPGTIARRLFPGDRLVRSVTGGHFSAVNLVRAFLMAREVPG